MTISGKASSRTELSRSMWIYHLGVGQCVWHCLSSSKIVREAQKQAGNMVITTLNSMQIDLPHGRVLCETKSSDLCFASRGPKLKTDTTAYYETNALLVTL